MAIHIDSDGNFYFGASGTTDFDNLSYTPVFSVTKDGVLTATSGTVGGISLASDHIKSTTTVQHLVLRQVLKLIIMVLQIFLMSN